MRKIKKQMQVKHEWRKDVNLTCEGTHLDLIHKD